MQKLKTTQQFLKAQRLTENVAALTWRYEYYEILTVFSYLLLWKTFQTNQNCLHTLHIKVGSILEMLTKF